MRVSDGVAGRTAARPRCPRVRFRAPIRPVCFRFFFPPDASLCPLTLQLLFRPPRLVRHAYATKSNTIRKLRTPGGKLGIHVKKKTKGPQTPRAHGLSTVSSPGDLLQQQAHGHEQEVRDSFLRWRFRGCRARAHRARLPGRGQKIVKKVLKLQAALAK